MLCWDIAPLIPYLTKGNFSAYKLKSHSLYNLLANVVSAAAAKKEIFKYVVGGVDFGLTNPTVFLVVGQKADGSLWILDEIYRKQMTPENLVKSTKVLQQRWNVSRFYCDPSSLDLITALVRGTVPEQFL